MISTEFSVNAYCYNLETNSNMAGLFKNFYPCIPMDSSWWAWKTFIFHFVAIMAKYLLNTQCNNVTWLLTIKARFFDRTEGTISWKETKLVIGRCNHVQHLSADPTRTCSSRKNRPLSLSATSDQGNWCRYSMRGNRSKLLLVPRHRRNEWCHWSRACHGFYWRQLHGRLHLLWKLLLN